MENRFDVLLECKNNHIDMLLKDLEDAEEQNLKQYGAHVEIISQFLSKRRFLLDFRLIAFSSRYYTRLPVYIYINVHVLSSPHNNLMAVNSMHEND